MISAFILVQVGTLGSQADVRALHDALHAISGVKTVHFVAGPTDLIVFVDAADQADMMRAVGEIRATSGVASTDTRIVLPV